MSNLSPAVTPLSLEAVAFVPHFVTAICQRPDAEETGQTPLDWLKTNLRVTGVELEPAEGMFRIIHGGITIGRARVFTREEAVQAFGNAAPFLTWKSACPFVGSVSAYLAWDQFVAPDAPGVGGAFTNLVRTLASAEASFFFRLDTGELRELARRRDFPLTDLASRWGFSDGDALLSRRESGYASDCCNEARERIAALGYRAEVEWVRTSHNPLRLAWHEMSSFWRRKLGFEPQRVPALFGSDGKPRKVSVLDNEKVSLWTIDFSVLDAVDFWNVPRPNY